MSNETHWPARTGRHWKRGREAIDDNGKMNIREDMWGEPEKGTHVSVFYILIITDTRNRQRHTHTLTGAQTDAQ